MLRVFTLFALATGLCAPAASRAEEPKCNNRPFYPFLATARIDHCERLDTDWPVDSGAAPRVLMLDYNAFDSAYATKVRRLIKAQMPASFISEFWEGTSQELSLALAVHDAVVITYPTGGNADLTKSYGRILMQYVTQGGIVVLTGTDDYRVLQQFGLFDVQYGYFCQDPVIHEINPHHPILDGTTGQFPLSDYAYPLDIADPHFVTLVDVVGYEDDNTSTRCWSDTDEVNPADLRNFPVIGFKNIGAGKVVYLGMEYYHDQTEPARILANTLRWAIQPKSQAAAAFTAREVRVVKRSEEVLQAGSGMPKEALFDLKIYPNPYYEKATLDIELKKSSPVAVEMTDESGRIVAVVLPQKTLTAGFYRLELPNLPPGGYFVQCKTGEKTVARKVVKAQAN